MATALAHDIGVYANSSGSTVFMCALDAEGAFDCLPHPIILQKVMGVVPDMYWRILYVWYAKMCVFLRWNNVLGNKIKVNQGTRQGGLTSPWIFNLFYLELIDDLNDMNVGVSIGGHNFNVICYADDILLCSTTSSGLQCLINRANEYISMYGLRFNPQKTECLISGPNPFNCTPVWSIDNVILKVVPSLKYLGTSLDGGNHVQVRKQAAQRAFYSIQGAGVKYGGVSPATAVNIYNAAVCSVILHGCSSIHLSNCNLRELDKMQSKHVKCIMGLKSSSRTTVLLQSLSIIPVSKCIKIGATNVLKSCIASNTTASHFYIQLLKRQHDVNIDKTLLGRVNAFLTNNKMCFNKFILSDNQLLKRGWHRANSVPPGVNGMVDTIRALVDKYSNYNRDMVQLLLNSY